MISGQQVRNARALLGWTARELARRANVRVFTIAQIEQVAGPTRYPGWTAVRAALNAAGVVFLDGVAPAVQLAETRKHIAQERT